MDRKRFLFSAALAPLAWRPFEPLDFGGGSAAPLTEDALEALERTRTRALVAGDLAVAAPLHAGDFEFVNPAGAALTRERFFADLANGVLAYRRWEPTSEIAVRLHGDAACLRYCADIAASVGGRASPARPCRITDFYERRDGRWQIVWLHATEVR